jgi:UDP-N-acetylmuramoyl-tripeptide--D-alanyl-D-alanine ligase
MNHSTEELYRIYLDHPFICTDTRSIKPGSIFFCLKGANFNGNSFASDALGKGAAFAVIDESEFKLDERYILVSDVLSALQQLASHHRSLLKIPVIGITGTNGKTTTKELIHAVMKKKYNTVATAGNLNNHIGVPLTILSVGINTEIVIVEMGANHQGEIAQLSSLARPDYGIITNISKAHTEGFGSYENIVKTKNELYQFIRSTNGKLFVNSENPLLMELSHDIPRILFGNHKDSLCSAEILDSNPFLILKYSINKKELLTTNYELRTNIIGSYNLENILASICIGTYFNIPPDDILQAIEDYKPGNYRSQFISTQKNKIIMDAYNANPKSMEFAISNFAALNMKNKIAIIGDMFELGKDAEEEHLKVIDLLKKQSFQKIYLVGQVFYSLISNMKVSNLISDNLISDNTNFESFPDSQSACSHFLKNPISSKSILIKGSRGVKLEKILDTL